MALDFPSSPSVGDPYPPPPAQPRWIWNGTSWVSAPAVTGLYLPIAGGTMTGPGNLTVDGNTTLNGVTVVDNNATVTGNFDVSGTTLLDGVTADSITLTTAPTQNMQVANKQYVDEEVAAGGLWKGTWDAENNVPDLTATAMQVNAWGWTVTTSDHTAPFTIPATPVIPGLNGVTVYDGDHVIWSDSASAFEVVHGSSLSRQEAEAEFEQLGQLSFRAMTPDLHDWIPTGTSGLFVGEGNPANSPPGLSTGPGFHPPITGITKWRFICSSDGDAMTMTATSIGTAPNRTRMFQKMKKAGDTWDYRWVEYANEYNFKMAGRNTRLVNSRPMDDWIGPMWPPTNPTERIQARMTGYRPSHAGLIHSGRFGNTIYSHTMPKIENLPIALLPDWYGSQNMHTQGGATGTPTNATYIDLKRRATTGHPRRRRYLRIPAVGGTPYYRFNFNVFPAFTTAQPTSLDVLQATVIIDFRLVNNANARWIAWDHGGMPMTHTFKTGIGFRKNGGNGWESWFRIGHYYPPDMTAAQMQNPSGQVFTIDFDYSPRFDLCTVKIYCHPSILQRFGMTGT